MALCFNLICSYFFDRVKVHLSSLNLKAIYSCVILILLCPGYRSLANIFCWELVWLILFSLNPCSKH